MSEGLRRARLLGCVGLSLAMALIISACGPDSNGHATLAPIPVASPTPNPAVASACVASGAMAIDVNSANGQVSVYAPAGDWSETPIKGVFLVPVEAGGVIGTGVTRATIATPHVVNSCSANSATGIIICSANNTDAYLINRSTLTPFTLTSSGSGMQFFSGGGCTNCNALADPVTDTGIVGISLSSGVSAGYQFFSLSSGSSLGVVTVPGTSSGSILSESPAIEPNKHWVLSGNEDSDFQIINFSGAGVFRYADRAKVLGFEILDGSAIDCTTDIAVGGNEGTSLFITDLSQAVFTPGSGGSPGTWTAPAQLQALPGLLSITTTGVAVAPSGHVGIMQSEFGGNDFAAFSLPSTSGSGMPAVQDWVAAKVPTQPVGTWSNTFDPHGLTAYTSPATGAPMGVLLNAARTFIAVVDLNKLLAAPRSGPHTTTVDLAASGILTFVSVH